MEEDNFYGRKMKDNLSQKIHRSMMFSVCSVKMVFHFPTNTKLPFCQKNKGDLFPKNTPKDNISGITEKDDICPRKDDIGILDWYSRKSANVSLYIYEDLFMCFHILPSNEKTQKTEYEGLKFDFICTLYDWRCSAMKNFRYPVPSSSQESCLEVRLSVS